MKRPLAFVLPAFALTLLPVLGAAAQARSPLLKTDLIELLSSPVIASGEVAVLVRRNCLAFRPTERDIDDIRRLGATVEVLSSISSCRASPLPPSAANPNPAPAAPAATSLQVVVRQPRIVAAAGSQERIVVLAARGGIPQAGVPITLRGSGSVEGSSRDVTAATDDSGFAVLSVRVGRRLATYRLEVVTTGGVALPGRPTVELVVRPGPPAVAVVDPAEIVFEEGDDAVLPLVVTVRDSVGHPIGGEQVVLASNPDAVGFPADTAVTDSLGRARLQVARGNARRGATLPVRVRGRQLALVDALVGGQLLETNTGFLPDQSVRGIVHSSLGLPILFGARTRLGRPAAGRTVTFRAVNAKVSPAVATTDSSGRAHVDVTLGDRAGSAVVLATIDSIEKQLVLQVEPGPPTELLLEYEGRRVDSRWVVVDINSTFTVRVRARDAYGNSTGVASLARMMRATPFNEKIQIAQLVNVQEEESTVALTLKATNPGRATVKLHMGDIGASLWLEVVQGR